MRYILDGKTILIPDIEIKNNMTGLGVSKEEAIQIWLEDNDKLTNDEQEALDETAKTVKIDHGASAVDKTEKKPKKPRTYVNTNEKDLLCNRIESFLQELEKELNGHMEVVKKGKLFQFTFNSSPDRPIKIDLIQKAKPK